MDTFDKDGSPVDKNDDIITRDGYVYDQSVRGADAKFKAWVPGGGYITDKITDDGNEKQKKKSKKIVSMGQKQMAYYSEKYTKTQKADRKVMLPQAKN